MKRKINYLLMLLFLLTSINSYSQTSVNPIDTLNMTLRKMFYNTTPPSPSVGYLYDMAAHLTDSQFFEPIVPIISNTENWFMIHEEMNNMAYNTTNNINTDTLYKRAFIRSQDDTVQIGMIFKQYYTLISDALSTDQYFEFDTTNTLLIDKAGRPTGPCDLGPYCQKTIFSMATLTEAIEYSKFTMVIDPAFFFHDITNIDYTFKLDLGDGNTPQTVDPFNISYIPVDYATAGIKTVTMRVYSGSTLVAESSCQLEVLRMGYLVTPDYNVDYPGLYVSVFGSCYSDESERKIAIVLEGIDPLDFFGKNVGHSAGYTYNQVIRIPEIEELRKYGYEFWVVNWDNSMQDLRANADNVINMIQDLQQTINTDNQFVIIGASLGGVVGRYALTKMEKNNMDHSTRELITIDSPHDGANIPISIQLLYRDLVNMIDLKGTGYKYRLLAKAFNIGLDAKASRQLLLYHETTEDNDTYSSAEDREEFLNDLMNKGNYPEYCKIVSVTNGSLTGRGQNRAYSNDFRVAGDRLLDFDGTIYVKFLKLFTIRIIGTDLELNTNPDGDGDLYRFTVNTWIPRIRLRFWGVRLLSPREIILLGHTKYGRDIKPYCVNAGGILAMNMIQPVNTTHGYTSSSDWAFLFNVKTTNNGNGLYTFESNVGNPWVVSAHADFSIYSDGFHFSFIPVQSSIDYEDFPNIPLDKNLVSTLPSDIMKHTPFDAVIGPSRGYIIPSNDDFIYTQAHNLMHVSLDMINSPMPTTCNSFDVNQCDNLRRVINTEIGEDILHLDNFLVNQGQTVRFSANRSIIINKFTNPFYEYEGSAYTPCADAYDISQPICFSKKNNYDVISSSLVEYLTTSLSMTGVSTHEYTYIEREGAYCCELISARLASGLNDLVVDNSSGSILIYPNSFEDNITIQFNNEYVVNDLVEITLTDMLGRTILKKIEPISANRLSILELESLQLSEGTYFISIFAGEKVNTYKVFKKNK